MAEVVQAEGVIREESNLAPLEYFLLGRSL
jgi:hypothetical protein